MQLKTMAVRTVVAAGATGIIVTGSAPAAMAGETSPSPFAPHSSSPAAEPSPKASPTRTASRPAVELRGLPRDFVPGATWQEFAVVLHHADTAEEFNRLFFQVHDTQEVGLRADQIEVQYFLGGRWRSTLSFNDPSDNWQDFPVPEGEEPVPADVTEIPVRLRFGADTPLADRVDIGVISYYGATEVVGIQPLKVIRLVRDTPEKPEEPEDPGESTDPGTPTGPGDPTESADPGPSPTARPSGGPGEPGSEAPGPSATAAPPVPGGGAGPGTSSAPAAPASGGELARTGADPVSVPLATGLAALGSGTVLALAAARVRRRRRRAATR